MAGSTQEWVVVLLEQSTSSSDVPPGPCLLVRRLAGEVRRYCTVTRFLGLGFSDSLDGLVGREVTELEGLVTQGDSVA